jgi:hypothetical protein
MKAVRMDKMGVDDVAIDATMFRLERMDRNVFWAAAYVGDKRVTFTISSKAAIKVEVVEDDIGCIDDSHQGDTK